MDVEEIIEEAGDTLTVKRVFNEPYEKDGITIITAAAVRGGGGGGEGEDPSGKGKGQGGGFGMSARPAGAYIIKDGDVRWQSAIDRNRLIGTIGAVAITAMLTMRGIIKARVKRRKR